MHWFLNSFLNYWHFNRLNIILGVRYTVYFFPTGQHTVMLTLHFSFNCFVMQVCSLHNSGNYPARWPTYLAKRSLIFYLFNFKKTRPEFLNKSGCMSVRNVNILPWFPNSRSRVTTCLLRRMYSRIIFWEYNA